MRCGVNKLAKEKKLIPNEKNTAINSFIMIDEKKKKPNYFLSIFSMKCPRCRKGKMFKDNNAYKKISLKYFYNRKGKEITELDGCYVIHPKDYRSKKSISNIVNRKYNRITNEKAVADMLKINKTAIDSDIEKNDSDDDTDELKKEIQALENKSKLELKNVSNFINCVFF